MIKIYKLTDYKQNRSNTKIVIEDNVKNITLQLNSDLGFHELLFDNIEYNFFDIDKIHLDGDHIFYDFLQLPQVVD